MKFLLYIPCILLLSSCSIFSEQHKTNTGAFQVILNSEGKYIFKSWWESSNKKQGKTSPLDDEYTKAFTIRSNNSEVNFLYENSIALKECFVERKEELNKFRNTYNNVDFLDKNKIKYTINFIFTKEKSFSISNEIDINNIILDFYMPEITCNQLVSFLSSSYIAMWHEIAHIYFLKKGIFDFFTLSQNEYWATRLSVCNEIIKVWPKLKNIPPKVFNVYNFTDDDKKDYLSKNPENQELGYFKFSYDLLKIVQPNKKHYENTFELSVDSKNYEKAIKWCKYIP